MVELYVSVQQLSPTFFTLTGAFFGGFFGLATLALAIQRPSRRRTRVLALLVGAMMGASAGGAFGYLLYLLASHML